MMDRARDDCLKMSILGRKRVCIQIRKLRWMKYKYGQFWSFPPIALLIIYAKSIQSKLPALVLFSPFICTLNSTSSTP